MIFDARFVNAFKVLKSFRLCQILDIFNIFDSDGLVVSADASSAFSQVPLAREEMINSVLCFPDPHDPSKKLFYAYTCPPFGATQVPRTFQRIMGAVRDVFIRLGFPSALCVH